MAFAIGNVTLDAYGVDVESSSAALHSDRFHDYTERAGDGPVEQQRFEPTGPDIKSRPVRDPVTAMPCAIGPQVIPSRFDC